MYSKREEFWNTVTHVVGVPLGVIGLILLLKADHHQTEYSTLSIWMYGGSIILLYSASTLYHAVPKLALKPLLRKFDHISIYFLIAGTYTPVALISLLDGSGWSFFWTVWGITAIGVVLKVFFTGKFEAVSLILYLIMGWLIVFDYSSVVAAHSSLGLSLLAAGGACYTVGIIFYVVEKIPMNHAIWHLFVLAGSICHFLFIWWDVVS